MDIPISIYGGDLSIVGESGSVGFDWKRHRERYLWRIWFVGGPKSKDTNGKCLNVQCPRFINSLRMYSTIYSTSERSLF